MKGLLFLLLASFVVFLTSCGNDNDSAETRTLEGVLQAFESAGFDTSDRETPLYQLIGASGGVQFVIEGQSHTVYSFSTEAALEQAFNNFPFMREQGWVTNGRFVIESNVSEINSFFAGIE